MISRWSTKKLGEKDDVEYKSEFNGSDREWLKLIKTIVSMANKRGGKIYYQKMNVSISTLDSANIDNKVNSFISPKLHGLVSKQRKSGVEIVVPNSELKPHIFIKRGVYKNEKGIEVVEFYEGQIWVRHSSKNELISKEDFDNMIQEYIKKFLERINVIAMQYPGKLEKSEFGMPMKINPIKSKREGIPVYVEEKRIDPNVDFPYQAKDLARILGKNSAYINQLLKILGIKGDPQFNYDFKNSSGKIVLRKYNDKCLEVLQKFLIERPDFNPWHDKL